MTIETDRLVITELTVEMAQDVHENSLDEDTRRFVPDEVFETVEDARETIEFLMAQYGKLTGPLVYAVLTKDGQNVGYVQMVPLQDGTWEIGYHIAKKYTGNGYATEAVRAFLPEMVKTAGIRNVYGICLKDNTASCRVLTKCGFVKRFSGMGKYQGEEQEICRWIWSV